MQLKKLLFAATMFIAFGSNAQTNYKLDSTFGTNAIASDFLPGASAVAYATATQADGKVVAVGGYFNTAGTASDSLLVMRLKADGSRDSSFGTNGLIMPPGLQTDYGRRVKIAADGKIILATRSLGTLRKIGVTRLNEDGSNDASFNGGNTVVIGDPAFHMSTMTMVVQSTGKIVVCARKGLPGGAVDTMVFYRINTDGTVDMSYGDNGVMKYPTYFDLGNVLAAFEVAQDAADRLYCPTLTSNVLPVPLQVMRYTADGQLDATYGTEGYSDEIGAQNAPRAFSFTQLDNGMIAGAFIANGVLPVQIINTFRWDTTGYTDMSYGTSGMATTPYSGFDYVGIHQKSIANGDHQLVLFDIPGEQAGYRSVVMMDIDEHGVPDSAFGENSVVRVDQTTAANATMWGAQKQADGSIIASTWMVNSHGSVIRFKPTSYQSPSSVTAVQQLNAAVYPNPVQDELILKTAQGTAYMLYDATGKCLLQGHTTGARTSLRTANLPAGLYALVCTDGTHRTTIRVTKQ